MKGSRIAGVLVMLSGIAVAWLFAAPAALGGQMRAYSIAGASMEPRFHAGDLVLVRPQQTYAPGDVVAYRSDTVGAILLHRITVIDDGLATLRGDANSDDDPDRPAVNSIIGALIVRIPAGGRVARTISSPMVLVAFLGTALLRSGRRRARGKHRKQRSSVPSALVGDAATARIATTIAASLAGICAAAAAGIWLSPPASTTTTLGYEQHGAFSYEADAPRSIYLDGLASTGEAVFTSITDQIRVAFDYGLVSDTTHQISGTIGLHATIDDGNGWTRALVLAEPSGFTGDAARVEGILDLTQIARIRTMLERRTGVQRIIYRIDLQPIVEVHGTLDSTSFSDTFTPTLPLEHDGTIVRFIASGDAAVDPIFPMRAGSIAAPSMPAVGEIRLGDRSFPRSIAAAVLGTVALLLAGAWQMLQRAGAVHAQRTPSERIRARFGARVVSIARIPDGLAVPVEGFDDFCRLAATGDAPVFACSDPQGTSWLLEHGTVRYAYRDGAPVFEHRMTRRPAVLVGGN